MWSGRRIPASEPNQQLPAAKRTQGETRIGIAGLGSDLLSDPFRQLQRLLLVPKLHLCDDQTRIPSLEDVDESASLLLFQQSTRAIRKSPLHHAGEPLQHPRQGEL